MGKGNNAVSGYDYYIGLHFGISHGPIDNFLELRGGNLTAWTGNVTASGAIQINFPTLYGGSTREGGLLGQLDIMMGEPTQMPNAYLTAQQGNPQPAYRGTCTVVYEGGLIGSNNPYPKPWAFRIRRVLKGWFNNAVWEPTLATVPLSNGAIGMNPAHIVYEVITNPDWGMGYPASQIDTANFLIAATQLQAEGTGLCLLWNRQDTIENFLQTLMDYMAAVLVSSPTTGLFQLNLIRGGYDIATLPVFTQDDVIELSSKEDSSITGCTNEMVVKFFDPINKINQICTLQALGAIQAQRVVVSTVKEYPGIATMDLASRVAQRDLAAVSTPLKRIEIKFNRKLYTMVPGSLFVLTFPDAQLDSVIFRVGEVDYGKLTDGAIKVTAVQDVFSLPSDTYIAPQVSGWVVPNPNPVPPTIYVGLEAGYRDLILELGASAAAAVPPGDGYIGVLVAQPNGLQFYYAVAVATAPFTTFSAKAAAANWAPSATVLGTLDPFETTCTFQALTSPKAITTGIAALISDGTQSEIVRLDAFDATTGVATIGRGCCDTVAWPHAAAIRVFFMDNFSGTDGVAYTNGEVVEVKPLPDASNGQLAIGLAPTITITMAERAFLPYPPAFPTINGTRYDLFGTVTGTFTLAWIERNRVTQAESLLDQTAGTVTPEAGTTYSINVYDNNTATLLQSWTGLTATSQAMNFGYSTILRIELFSMRGGLKSWQTWEMLVTFANNSVQITDESGNDLTDESGNLIFSE
jgi:Putative phage tail protein